MMSKESSLTVFQGVREGVGINDISSQVEVFPYQFSLCCWGMEGGCAGEGEG